MIRLKQIRKERKFTQEQLAKYLGVDRSQIGKYEHGRTLANSEQIIAICKALNCSADYLLGLIDEEKEDLEKKNQE